MNGFVRFLVSSVSQLIILLGKIKGRFSSLFKILVYVYSDLNLFFRKRKIIKYYKLNTLDILLK